MKFPKEKYEQHFRGWEPLHYDSARWGFEEAKKLMLAKIEKVRKTYKNRKFLATNAEINAVYMVLDELEGELKVDSASREADAVEEVGLK